PPPLAKGGSGGFRRTSAMPALAALCPGITEAENQATSERRVDLADHNSRSTSRWRHLSSPRFACDVQGHVGPHPHADRPPGHEPGPSLPIDDLRGGPRPRPAEEAEVEVQESADLADPPGAVLTERLPDGHDTADPERPRDPTHQLTVGRPVEVM